MIRFKGSAYIGDNNQTQSMALKVLPLLSLLLLTTPISANQISNQATNPIHEQNQAKPAIVNLPNPLSLSFLLNDFSLSSPHIALQQSQLDSAKSEQLQAGVKKAWKAGIEGRLGWREFANENQDNHALSLHVSKLLYDAGRSEGLSNAAQQSIAAEQLKLVDVQNQQRLEVVQAFLNVLLADFQYRIDNEAMAVAYVGQDKLREQHALGRASDVRLLEVESQYEKAAVKRKRSEYQQLQRRIQLANRLGYPQLRPDELKFPSLKKIPATDIKALNLEALQTEVLNSNPSLQVLRQQLKSQEARLASSRALDSPTLKADAWAGKLSSQPTTREGAWRTELSINIPFVDGGLQKASTASAMARLKQVEAQSALIALQLRDQVAELYFQLQMLEAEKKQHQAFGDYADLYLDYSRALYEHESATDLGDAMVRLSQANYNMVAWQFKKALLWAQLDLLKGQTIQLN